MAFRSSSLSVTNGNSSSTTVPVPAGAAADDIAVICVSVDNGSVPTFTWPSGFTELAKVNITSPDGHYFGMAWKRLTGADAGTYSFSWSNSGDYQASCLMFSGRHTTNPPVASTLATSTASNSSPVTITANGVTAVDGDDLVWIAAPDTVTANGGTSFSPPATFTERQDEVNSGGGDAGWTNLSTATKDNVSSGATGGISGTFISTVNSGWIAALIRIPAAAGGASPSPFVQEDWPLPQGPQFPTSLRTWVASYNLNLIGKDVLPPGRKGAVFEGPPKAPRPAGPTWTSRYNSNLIGKDVFPAGRRNPQYEEVQPILWRRGWELNLLQATLAPTAAVVPFRQRDWPLPQRAPQPDRTWVSSAAMLQLLLPPPGDIWTDLPPRSLFWRNGSVLNLLQSTLTPVVAVPFAQYDWPLPRTYPQPDRTWITFFNPNLVAQDALPPGVVRSERAPVVSWKNGFELNLLLSTLATVVQMPLNQYDWRIPGQGWQPPRTWTTSYNINLISQDQFPIRQMDWPLPKGYFYPASVRVAAPLNMNLFPPPPPPIVVQEYRNVKVAGGEFGFMGLRGGVIG